MLLTVNGKDMTALLGNLTLTTSMDTLGDQLDFEIPYSDMYYYPKQKISVGDIIQLFDDKGKEVFRGIVISSTKTKSSQSFQCFDFAFYLNKSKIIKQFYKVRADTAIKQLLKECEVPYGKIADMPTIINEIYYDKEVSEVIKDILEQATGSTGNRYYMEMEAGALQILEDGERMIQCNVKLAENIAPMDVMQTISEPSKEESIEEMKNSIVIYSGSDKDVRTVAEAKNTLLIAKYGLLQETKSIEEKELPQAKNIAQNLLNELGVVKSSASLTVLGNFDLRAGRVVEIKEEITGIEGKFKIVSATHTIGKIHTCSLELEAV